MFIYTSVQDTPLFGYQRKLQPGYHVICYEKYVETTSQIALIAASILSSYKGQESVTNLLVLQTIARGKQDNIKRVTLFKKFTLLYT